MAVTTTKRASETWDAMHGRHHEEEGAYLRRLLASAQWQVAPAARSAGIPHTTLQRALERHPDVARELGKRREKVARA